MFTSDSWSEAGLPGSRGGTFGCFPVAGVALGGFAKPRGSPVVRIEDHPVAALEKIASDLAFDLGLPVPPAVLWEREGPRSHGRQLIISAAPFDGALTWLQVEAAPPSVAARILPTLSPSASAIAAFDTWLMNGDRVNRGNILVREDVGPPALTRVAYIDFANSLSRVFRIKPDIWKDEGGTVPMFPHGLPVDLASMDATVSAIEKLPEAQLRVIVERIPARFLLPQDRDEILAALLYRQPRLRGIMKKSHPGLP